MKNIFALNVRCANKSELQEVHEKTKLTEYHGKSIDTETLETIITSSYVKEYDFIGVSNSRFGIRNIWEGTLYDGEIITVYQKIKSIVIETQKESE